MSKAIRRNLLALAAKDAHIRASLMIAFWHYGSPVDPYAEKAA